eukprot:2035329-Pleurochrysis_carterae.AAC.2
MAKSAKESKGATVRVVLVEMSDTQICRTAHPDPTQTFARVTAECISVGTIGTIRATDHQNGRGRVKLPAASAAARTWWPSAPCPSRPHRRPRAHRAPPARACA